MQATRYFAGTDRDALHRAQDLAGELGHDDVHRTLKWSEWAALSTTARIAEAQPMAEQYLARWGEDPRPQVRASAHTLFGVDEWTRGRIRSAMQHLDAGCRAARRRPATRGRLRGRAASHRPFLRPVLPRCPRRSDTGGGARRLRLHARRRAAGGGRRGLRVGAAVGAVHTRWDAVDRLVRHALELDPAAQFAFFGGQLLMFRGLVEATAASTTPRLPASWRAAPGCALSVAAPARRVTRRCSPSFSPRRVGSNDAAELAAGARLQTDESGEGWNEVTICIAEGVVAAASGNRDRAVERLTTAVATGKEQGADALADRAAAILALLPADPPRR